MLLTAETEPNDTLAQATILPVQASDELTGSISTTVDIDFFRRTLAQGENLRVTPDVVVSPATPYPGQLHKAPAVEIQDAAGNVLARSLTGHAIEVMAAAAGDYYIRLFTAQSFGDFTGSYGVDIAVSSFVGDTESEPNDTLATADPLGASPRNFRGTLASGSDVDYFSFAGTAGQVASIKLVNRLSANPGVRLFNPSNVEIAANSSGLGLQATLPVTGTYRFELNAGATGEYVGSVLLSTNPVIEQEPFNSFSGAPTWTLGSTRAVGSLANLTDVDAFSVNLVAGQFYLFTLEAATGKTRQNRTLALYNELGQFLEYTTNGVLATNAATGFGFRVEQTGKHYVTVQAMTETGLGPFSVFGQVTSTFPTARDVPLYFLDYTDQVPHLGEDAQNGITDTARIPLLVGMFESQYDIYDIDTVTTNPGAGTYVGHGLGNFPDHGGLGGSFDLNQGNSTVGTRRVSGDSFTNDDGASWTRLADMEYAISVTAQEAGHASGIYAHARHPLASLAYDNQAFLNVVGSYFPFPWTDSRVPDVETRNQRDFLDLVLQSGRIAQEVEANNSIGTAQNLDPFFTEMMTGGDIDPQNDRVTVLGQLDGTPDVDVYRFTAAAGESFAIDIDAAELQRPLDAAITILDSGGATVASNMNALDRESGLFSVDPYLVQQFATAGTYYIRVSSERGSVGNYRLKVIADQAFDTAGPRVMAAWPNGGSSIDSTKQLIFWFDDQIDPATLAGNVTVAGPGGNVAGSATFDPLDSTMIWTASAPLVAGAYTVTINASTTGIKDLRGNRLDGETSGTLAWPNVSGNGAIGGDFVTTFTITGPDTTAASVSSSSYRRHPYNRGLFTLNFNDELSIVDVYNASITLRGDGLDNTYNTSDDTFTPIDVLYEKLSITADRRLEIYTRGVPDADSYRLEASFLDAAGNTVNLSRTFTVGVDSLISGPVIADVNVQPGTVLASGPSSVQVTFSGNVNTSTLTTSNFVVRSSPDPTFFDGNDVFISDADGLIAWDAATHRATFQPAASLTGGYYLVELEGDTGGIADTSGRLLDGEYLDSNIAGGSLFSLWKDAPSGDGLPGGDYRAFFSVDSANTSPTISNIANQNINSNTSTGAISFTIGDAETPAGSLTLSGDSSNNTLVPNSNIVFGGSGANRTVTVTPAPNGTGTAIITVTVTDSDNATAFDNFLLTVIGPSVVISHTPIGAVTTPVSSVDFNFSQPMNTTSFAVPDDVVSFTGPGGNLLPQVSGFSWVDSDTLRVAFTSQATDGNYALVIGPQILASVGGLAMDQDADGTIGEAVDDRYTANFAIDICPGPEGFGYNACATTFENIDLVFGAAGVFSIVDGADDSFAAVALGTNTFNFYGTSFTGASSLFVNTNGLITFSSGTNEYSNSDLTSVPSQRAIAPLWDDWRTDIDANDRVLGKFEDTNADTVMDRLIIEWSDIRNFGAQSATATFQAILQLNSGTVAGSIIFNYPDLDVGNGSYNNGASATIGIKDTGTQGANRLLISQNNAANSYLGTGKAILLSSTSLSIAATDASKAEGNSGNSAFTFTVTRTGYTNLATNVNYTVLGNGANPANATDFGGALPSGTVVFSIGETSKLITINVSGDTVLEPNEGFTVTLTNASGGAVISTATATGTILNDDSPLFLALNYSQTSTGVIVNFNRPLNPSPLNLYDIQGNVFGAPDLTLVGATNGTIRGSLVIDPNLQTATFVATAGRLPPDNYTLTLRSDSAGFQDALGEVLDGDANGAVGGDYVRTFAVTAPAANAVTVSTENFARGPLQGVNLPANSSDGIPISLSNAVGITSAAFEFHYDPALLTIVSAAAPLTLVGASVTLDTSVPGVATIQFSSPTALAAGATRIVNLQATVPGTAPYRNKHVLDLANISLNGGAIPALDDDAVHVAAYFADVTGNGTYSAQDASYIARNAVGIDTGLEEFRLLDPTIIGDITGNSGFSATDTSYVLQAAVGIPVVEIPSPLPTVSLLQGGPDPKLSIPQDLSIPAGGSLVIPVNIDSIVDLTGNGLESADLVIYYDPAVFEVTAAALGRLVAQRGWMISSHINSRAGRIDISLAGMRSLEGQFIGELVQLHATVKSTAPAGATPINLAATSRSRTTQLNEGFLTLIPAPTDAANDSIDGRVTITRQEVNTPASAVRQVNNHLMIMGTAGDDHLIVSPAEDRVRVRLNHQLVGTFDMPAGIVIDGLTGRDQIMVVGLQQPTLITFSEPSTAVDDDVIFGLESAFVVDSNSDSTADLTELTAADLAAKDLALIQLLTELTDNAARSQSSALRFRRR